MIPIADESSRLTTPEPGARLSGETVGALVRAAGDFGTGQLELRGRFELGRVLG
jgi:hypothetical protein